jgi:hypothetical protein
LIVAATPDHAELTRCFELLKEQSEGQTNAQLQALWGLPYRSNVLNRLTTMSFHGYLLWTDEYNRHYAWKIAPDYQEIINQ